MRRSMPSTCRHLLQERGAARRAPPARWPAAAVLLLPLLALCAPRAAAGQQRPTGPVRLTDWARCEGGQLTYKTTPQGDRLMDFSTAGYRGGDAAIPDARNPDLLARLTTREVRCTGEGDDTPAINKALRDVASGNTFDRESGLRGVVLLVGPRCRVGENSTISITSSGVVLRNSGPRRVLITRAGGPRPLPTINVAPPTGAERDDDNKVRIGDYAVFQGQWLRLGDTPVPAGSRTLEVEVCALAPGDKIAIRRLGTKEWAAGLTWESGLNPAINCTAAGWGVDVVCSAADANAWNGGPNAKPPGKDCGGMASMTYRTVISVTPLPQPWPGGGTCRVALDAPVSDAIGDGRLGRGWVRKYAQTSRPLRNVGIEGLDAQIPAELNCLAAWNHFIKMAQCEDCWVRDIESTGYNYGVWLTNVRRVTVASMTAGRGQPWPSVPVNLGRKDFCPARPTDFSIGSGSESVLVVNCTSTTENVYSLMTGSLVTGPVVVSNFRAVSPIQPHMRWATGLLIENVDAPVEFLNRRCSGTRHGFAVGYSVIWNANPPPGSKVILDAPRGRPNWLIGGTTTNIGQSRPGECCMGIIDQPGVLVTPSSLYMAQLQIRQLGRTYLCP